MEGDKIHRVCVTCQLKKKSIKQIDLENDVLWATALTVTDSYITVSSSYVRYWQASSFFVNFLFLFLFF